MSVKVYFIKLYIDVLITVLIVSGEVYPVTYRVYDVYDNKFYN